MNGWEDTAERCRAYYEAGADLVFVDGIQGIKDVRPHGQPKDNGQRFGDHKGRHGPEPVNGQRRRTRLANGCAADPADRQIGEGDSLRAGRQRIGI